MVITFCGHSNLSLTDAENSLLKTILQDLLKTNDQCIFYLGGYGDFDKICLHTLKNLKNQFPTIKICFITPYIANNYSKLNSAKDQYDEIIYPPLENTPPKFAISKRNQWMIEQSQLVIAYVKYNWGGAFQTLNYAKQHHIKAINLPDLMLWEK